SDAAAKSRPSSPGDANAEGGRIDPPTGTDQNQPEAAQSGDVKQRAGARFTVETTRLSAHRRSGCHRFPDFFWQTRPRVPSRIIFRPRERSEPSLYDLRRFR